MIASAATYPTVDGLGGNWEVYHGVSPLELVCEILGSPMLIIELPQECNWTNSFTLAKACLAHRKQAQFKRRPE